ncbi:hypothetical protein A2363_01985 [Candidatus Gottesmanbacteria bacterium RIFOXYB1_FULL_47_11]|uniref:Rod shape-determining protein MreD n=1 Tax=Candidatus Gottesmanbacteria bacterium RIFOXYB1_FULL_47_11 TaxID=1798401 RepID=A0A1F6BDJ6_9BACT|nr:MAG: hypothetical protein A2363_01985 [Candidatus Gottesmanbacteria bacterium RIFOXYB1_FULL_47_11]
MDTLLLLIIGVFSRLVPHPANMTAVGALAIFSGARLGMKKSVIITIAVMGISDVILGFHSVMWATYGAMVLAVILGRYVSRSRSVVRIAGVTITSSVLFYLITNFAVWAAPGSMYAHTVSGLLDSYIMALPFFRNSLMGDMFYTALFFGAHEWMLARKPTLKVISTS